LLQVGGYDTNGSVVFNSGLTSPTLTIRGVTGGVSAATAIELANNTGSAETATLDTSLGNMDAIVTTAYVGWSNSSGQLTANLDMQTGTFNAGTINLGYQAATSTPSFTSTFNQNAGTVLAGNLTFGGGTGGTPTFTSAYNLGPSSGTASSGLLAAQGINISSGTVGTGSTSVLNFYNGTIENYDPALGQTGSAGAAGPSAQQNLTISGLTGGGAAGNYATLQINLASTGTHALYAESGYSITEASTALFAGTGGTLAITGPGTVILKGANTYTGGTTVSAGSLFVNNSTGSGTGTGAVTVNSGAALGGNGTIGSSNTSNGAITINNGGTIEAGPSYNANGTGTGLLTSDSTSGVSISGNSTYIWKVNADTTHGSAGSSTGWDEIATQGISLGGGTVLSSTNPFTVAITGAPSTGFGAGIQNFVIATAPTGNISVNGVAVASSGTTNLSATYSGDFVLSTSGFTAPSPGLTTSWQLEVLSPGSGVQDLDLVYNATPEPGTGMLIFGGAAAVLAGRRRRRGKTFEFPAAQG
jgi:autotransporter-associated beta strand protein